MPAPRIPPTIGKTMNTHSWLSAQLPWNMAVARLRAGLTDVLSIGIEMRWMTVRVRPTVTPVRPTGIDLRLVEAMTNTNMAVKKTSASITTGRGNPPGSGCRSRWRRSPSPWR